MLVTARNTTKYLLVSAFVLTGLTACGEKDEKKVATQVAAKVGSEEISVHQINQVLSRTNVAGISPQAIDALRSDLLEKLIDQQLAVQQAVEAKLNRSPEVVAQIEAARREVLARAYVQQIASSLPKPTTAEIKKYYLEHPQLFYERRIYNLQELVIPVATSDGQKEQLRATFAASKTLDEFTSWLKSKEIKFGGNAATRAAEQIPLELLGKLSALKDGQMTLIENPQGYTVVRVVASQSAPVTEATAQPRIEQFLTNQRGAEAVSQNIKQLRAKTTIAYMGDFVKAPGTVGASDPATAPAMPTAAVAGQSEPAVSDKTKTAIDKGVQGLK